MSRKWLLAAGLLTAGTLTGGQNFLSAPTDEYDTRTWGEVRKLNEQLARLSDGRAVDYYVTLWGDGRVWITIKRDQSDLVGKGRSPWEAAEDLISKSDKIGKGIEKALRPGS